MIAKELTADHMGQTFTIAEDGDTYTGRITRLHFDYDFAGGIRVSVTLTRGKAHAYLHFSGDTVIADESQLALTGAPSGHKD